MAHRYSRRHILTVAAALMATTVAPGVALARPDAPVTITLPAPTGPNPVGVTQVHLTDTSRIDPWDPARQRELIVQIWYPADAADTSPLAAWPTPGGLEELRYSLLQSGVAPDLWTLAPGHSRTDARAATGRYPLLLNSPGLGDTTGLNTAQAEDLASHGYIVAAINHTHEAFAVRFPDGRTERGVVPLNSSLDVLSNQLIPIRVADTSFVLDQLTDAATDPAAARPGLPEHLAEALDPAKVAMFGHSLGGSTAAQAMHDDRRIAAGVNLDGPMLGSVASNGLDKPLLLLAADTSPWFTAPGWEPYWANNTGLKLPLRIAGTRHMSLTDGQIIVTALADAGLFPSDMKDIAVGPIDPNRSVGLQRSYLLTYFDAVFGRSTGNPIEIIGRLAQPEMLPHH
ncbi:alpha/beta hydrolase family protein [Nocardia sp. NPDC057668]|uniref:alpha/beta hydrolase family protein n=1 Tax=Nocardia sp. NPDC057668 TaxID=3346202 RepID=UPI00366EA566